MYKCTRQHYFQTINNLTVLNYSTDRTIGLNVIYFQRFPNINQITQMVTAYNLAQFSTENKETDETHNRIQDTTEQNTQKKDKIKKKIRWLVTFREAMINRTIEMFLFFQTQHGGGPSPAVGHSGSVSTPRLRLSGTNTVGT